MDHSPTETTTIGQPNETVTIGAQPTETAAGSAQPIKGNTTGPLLSDKPPLPPKEKGKARGKVSGRKPSRAWDHFDKIKNEEDGKTRAVCKYCQKEYMAESKSHGTSNLLSHVASCLKYPYREQEKSQHTLSFQNKKDGDGVGLVATSFTVKGARKALAEMIILDELPFRFVEGVGFRRFCNALQPKFTMIPSRTTVAKDLVAIFNTERTTLRNFLKGRRVCLTTDTWTSIQNLNYMCLTAHFIDDDWKLQKRILNFCQVEDHKDETVGKRIELCLLEWNLGSVFTLTVDNASSYNTAIKFLKRKTKDWKGTVLGHEFLHMRCCAHILNLIVGEGLKELDTSICCVRDVVRYVRSSPNRHESFKKCVEMCQIESKSLLCLDIPTRWNSTYLMLESAEKFEKAFERLEEEDSNYRSYFLKGDREDGSGRKKKSWGAPTEGDWNNCRLFLKFLRLFYNATKRFSGSLYVTSNCFFDEMFVILTKIEQLSKKDGREDELLGLMAKGMKAKFDKYWGNGDKINLLMYVAVVLDPRKKLRYV
ncbi:zinc finger BED domain-containing protein RICESLEEPER 1-like [Camellia sinensis]|uniref:zinc finger BED domain-containing protein RICESLEEPER 1-like n=1 Tax=Camellia sinensis TaxID=4442 RepID=UPI0010356254|nr:zinc finger BED domain-containing protein RICESLEEPER 1-like [Camellia sinensis]